MHKPRCRVSTVVGIRGRCAGEGNLFDSDMHALGNHGGEDGGWGAWTARRGRCRHRPLPRPGILRDQLNTSVYNFGTPIFPLSLPGLRPPSRPPPPPPPPLIRVLRAPTLFLTRRSFVSSRHDWRRTSPRSPCRPRILCECSYWSVPFNLQTPGPQLTFRSAFWHNSMYGFNVTDKTFSYDNRPQVPLYSMTFDEWWLVSSTSAFDPSQRSARSLARSHRLPAQ